MPSIGAGRPIPKELLAWLRALKIDLPEDPKALWKELYAGGLDIAGKARSDVIELVRDSLAKSLEKGTQYKEWAAGLKDAIAKSGWAASGKDTPSRLRLIYGMAVRTSNAVGQWRRIEDTSADLPYLRYELGPVKTQHRLEHLPFDGLVLRADDPWWRDHLPPRGFRCQCRVRQISEYEARRLGVSVAPRARLIRWESSDGRVLMLPAGVEPGFETHPAFEGKILPDA